MRIAVTGATGFIGSHLIDRLLLDGHHMVALARNERDTQPLRARGISVIAGAVENADAVSRAVDGADVVFNLARAKAHGMSPEAELISTNVAGARNVARAAHQSRARLVHASSTAVYGSRVREKPSTEDSPLRADSLYARSKLEGENAVRSECPDAIVLRISAVLGPRCDSWLPLFRSASAGSLRLAGNGRNLNHAADVSDVVEALMHSATSNVSGRTFNIAGPEPVTMRRLVELMALSAGSSPIQPMPVPAFIADSYLRIGKLAGMLGVRLPRLESVMFLTGDRSFDISRARRELGFEPAIPIDNAVQRTADYYRSDGRL
jgi:nucleoside-diphosphate-sugar epimerase